MQPESRTRHLPPPVPQPSAPPAPEGLVVAAAPVASTSGSSGASGAAAGLGVLKAAAPIDRLRYQAMLLFDHFDADKDGRLAPSELAAFFTYSGRKVRRGGRPALTRFDAARPAMRAALLLLVALAHARLPMLTHTIMHACKRAHSTS